MPGLLPALINSKRECAVHDPSPRISGRLGGISNKALSGEDDCGGRVVVGIVRPVLSVAVVERAIVEALQPPPELRAKCAGVGLSCQNNPHAIERMTGAVKGRMSAGWKLKMTGKQALRACNGNH
jgi:hypothetical protein